MKKVVTIFLIALVIAAGVLGFIFKDTLIGLVNEKSGKKEVIPVVLNMEDNDTLRPFLEVQKKNLGKKEYKRFLSNLNQEVTSELKDISKMVAGYDTVENILFIDDESGKHIDFINMNSYGSNYKTSYTAFNWTDTPNPANPKWKGYFLVNDGLFDEVTADANGSLISEGSDVEEDVASNNVDTSDVDLFYNKEVLTEEEINAKLNDMFGDNYTKVSKLVNNVKSEIISDANVSTLFGSDKYGTGYGGVQQDDTIFVTACSLKDDGSKNNDNLVLLKISKNGDYTIYTDALKKIAKDSSPDLTVPTEETNVDAGTESESTTKESEVIKESEAESSKDTNSSNDVLDGIDSAE